VNSFLQRPSISSSFLNIHRSGVLTALAWLVPHETAAVSARPVYTTQRKVHAPLAVTCHLHFWQHDRCLLRATAVTQEWNEESAQKVDPIKENSPAAPAGIRTRDLLITNPALERFRGFIELFVRGG